jgi:hypothetical protein
MITFYVYALPCFRGYRAVGQSSSHPEGSVFSAAIKYPYSLRSIQAFKKVCYFLPLEGS